MRRNKTKMVIETGYLFFDNENSNESIYDFFLAQLDSTKKLILIEFEFSDRYENYIGKYIEAIKCRNDNKHEMLSHKNSKFLFSSFNNFLNRIGKSHIKILDDSFTLENLQEKKDHILLRDF